MGSPEEHVPNHKVAPSEAAAGTGASRPTSSAPPPADPFWARIRRHKVVEWTLAYVAFGYALLHGVQMLRETFDWPFLVPRLTVIGLVLGAPIAVTLAWYHGHRARHRVSGQELSILIALLVVAGSVLWWVSRNSHEHGTAPTAVANNNASPAPPAPAFNPPAHSVAVLPLTNESGDPSQQYFSDGLSEDLITALSQFPGLKVIGRQSSFQFRDSKENSHSIGAKLGVAHLLEGSVRRSGDVVRVRAELINAEDGSATWSERYDRPYKDLFALQDEVTRAVADALRAKLVPSEHAAAQSERPPSGSLDVYNAFLQGQFYLNRVTEADFRKAIESFTQATELDPRYALAWSKVSQVWTGLGSQFLEGAPAQEAFAKARAAADRALSLSPELAAAHVARGYVLQTADFDWRGAETEFRRAMELAPNDGDAKAFLGSQLATFGELEAAIELTRQALVTEPLRAYLYYSLSAYFSGLNRLDDAERAIRRAIELQPGAASYHEQLAIIEIQRGNAQAALAAAQQESPGNWQDMALALARQIGSDRSAADAALKTLIDEDAKDPGSASYQVAQVYALRNDAKETFAWLDRAWSSRDPGIGYLLFDPFILRYKDDPGFAAFCRKVGLPVPGERTGG
jgi:TolB-like protein/Tfp pilus assembly protein PilF